MEQALERLVFEPFHLHAQTEVQIPDRVIRDQRDVAAPLLQCRKMDASDVQAEEQRRKRHRSPCNGDRDGWLRRRERPRDRCDFHPAAALLSFRSPAAVWPVRMGSNRRSRRKRRFPRRRPSACRRSSSWRVFSASAEHGGCTAAAMESPPAARGRETRPCMARRQVSRKNANRKTLTRRRAYLHLGRVAGCRWRGARVGNFPTQVCVVYYNRATDLWRPACYLCPPFGIGLE